MPRNKKTRNKPRRSNATACVVVFVTCPGRALARRIAASLVQRHLAACVNVIPQVESFFWWQGNMERGAEALLMLKTTRRRLGALRRAVITLHPYDVPEVLVLPVIAGYVPYLRWVERSTVSPQ